MNDAMTAWLADRERVRILGAANPANAVTVAPNPLKRAGNEAAASLRIGCEYPNSAWESRPASWADSRNSQGDKHPTFANVESHLRRIALAARLPWTKMRLDPDGIRDVDIEDVREHWQDYTADPRLLRAYIAAVAYRLAFDPE